MRKIKTVNVIDRKNCTGCSACYSICPVKSIEFITDKEGFLFPQIDFSKCINCGMCYKACPLTNNNSNSGYNPKAYAMQNTDNDILDKSSSGGVFYELARCVLEENGVVYGCAMVKNVATHIRVDKKDNLFKILGSKYVQSDVSCFSEVKKDLKAGLKVLFSGTPCQIAGLKSYLGNDFENLLCVDFVCHGVPSPKVLDKYIDYCEKKYNTRIDNVMFRSKKFGWSKFAMELESEGKQVLCEPRSENIYLKAFLANVSIRSSCGNCKFNVLPRIADITLGDFWQGKLNNADEERGLSFAVSNTEKGILAINSIQDKFIKEQISLDDIKKGNPFINGHCKLSKKRKQFFKNLDGQSIETNIQKCIKPTFIECVWEVAMYKLKKVSQTIKVLVNDWIKKRINRFKLKNKDFTIISNNCWGGLISQKYALAYRSPTCGLLILGEDYIKFCSDLKHYLSQKLEFIEFNDGKFSSLFQNANFPVAKLDDIEVYFMHYKTNEEAAEKWYRRADRINWDCIVYKISERQTFTPELMREFAKLPLDNKLIFATSKYTKDTVIIPGLDTVKGDETPLLAKYFNEAKYLNKLKDRRK